MVRQCHTGLHRLDRGFANPPLLQRLASRPRPQGLANLLCIMVFVLRPSWARCTKVATANSHAARPRVTTPSQWQNLPPLTHRRAAEIALLAHGSGVRFASISAARRENQPEHVCVMHCSVKSMLADRQRHHPPGVPRRPASAELPRGRSGPDLGHNLCAVAAGSECSSAPSACQAHQSQKIALATRTYTPSLLLCRAGSGQWFTARS